MTTIGTDLKRSTNSEKMKNKFKHTIFKSKQVGVEICISQSINK